MTAWLRRGGSGGSDSAGARRIGAAWLGALVLSLLLLSALATPQISRAASSWWVPPRESTWQWQLAIPVDQSVGEKGSAGYDLAGWDGSSDVGYMPNATATLVKGSRYEWTAQTSDTRALQGSTGAGREAATYYDSNQIEVQLRFSAAYKGNLHLYALDWDSTARRETITANGQSASLTTGNFHQGAWVSFPIDVPAGATVPITVKRTAGANAVLSGIVLGDAGVPPTMPASSAPQGNWVGAHGSAGYDLPAFNGSSDLASLPNASLTINRGSRCRWSSTTDVRALESPDKGTRIAATLYDSSQIQLQLSFTAAYSGNLELYALDWDSTARRETVSVNGQTAVLSSAFNAGAWISFPITVQAGGTVTIAVDRLAGANAVLSGIFLG
jgi:hypothetical protein